MKLHRSARARVAHTSATAHGPCIDGGRRIESSLSSSLVLCTAPLLEGYHPMELTDATWSHNDPLPGSYGEVDVGKEGGERDVTCQFVFVDAKPSIGASQHFLSGLVQATPNKV